MAKDITIYPIFTADRDTESLEEVAYHLSCNSCGKIWWSAEAFPRVCPYCGARRDIKYS